MDKIDIIEACLSPGTAFNPNNKTFRSVTVLCAFTGLERENILEILYGDLGTEVVVKPSAKNPTELLVALRENLADPAHDVGAQVVKVAAGNAHVPPAEELSFDMTVEDGFPYDSPDLEQDDQL